MGFAKFQAVEHAVAADGDGLAADRFFAHVASVHEGHEEIVRCDRNRASELLCAVPAVSDGGGLSLASSGVSGSVTMAGAGSVLDCGSRAEDMCGLDKDGRRPNIRMGGLWWARAVYLSRE